MKKIMASLLIISFLPLLFSAGPEAAKHLEGTISISGAWALYPMALRWAEEFQKIHPKVRIDIQAGGAGKGIADVLAGAVDIGNVSRNIYSYELEKGAFPIAVCKDAVVPVCSGKNPFLDQVLKNGIERETFQDIWITEKARTWGDVLDSKDRSPVHVYTRSDACGAAETWAEFLGGRQEDLKGVGVFGDPGLAEAVRRDSLGIGYNNVNYAYDAKTKQPVKGLAIVPIDLDGNGRVDAGEQFYGHRDTLVQAIADSRYPSPPARDLYFVTKGRPRTKLLQEFIKWVLTDGQAFVPETGYITLGRDKLDEGLAKIGEKLGLSPING